MSQTITLTPQQRARREHHRMIAMASTIIAIGLTFFGMVFAATYNDDMARRRQKHLAALGISIACHVLALFVVALGV